MGLIETLLALVFGGGRNAMKETAEIFLENAEAGAGRDATMKENVLAQFAAEFAARDRGWFDRIMDGINRVPRPALAIGTLGLFISAMVDPIWFAARMQGIALVPEPLWWLLGVVVSFYFGARQQFKTQEFQRAIAATMSRTPQVMKNLDALAAMAPTSPGGADSETDAQATLHAVTPESNAALMEWRQKTQ